MPRGRPKKDLTALKDRLVALVSELARPATAAKDEELAETLGVPVKDLKRALKEVVDEKRVIRIVDTKKRTVGFTKERCLHVHRSPPSNPPKVKVTGFGKAVFMCPVCGEPLPN
jgi:transcription initiation factor IIE alpha subunit